jgi:hypothetical protein
MLVISLLSMFLCQKPIYAQILACFKNLLIPSQMLCFIFQNSSIIDQYMYNYWPIHQISANIVSRVFPSQFWTKIARHICSLPDISDLLGLLENSKSESSDKSSLRPKQIQPTRHIRLSSQTCLTPDPQGIKRGLIPLRALTPSNHSSSHFGDSRALKAI